MDKAAAIVDARIQVDHNHCYVPHYTPSIPQQGLLSKQISGNTPTELRYIERSVFMKEVNNQKLWNFELGSQESMYVHIWITIGFQKRDRKSSQKLNKETYSRVPVTSCQCIIGTEIYPDSGILLNYDDDDYSQGYDRIKEDFRALTKYGILQPYVSDHHFRSSNMGANDVSYSLYVFDIRYQQIFTFSPPIELDFKFDGLVCNDINGYAVVLTKKLVSIRSDVQRAFDLI